ncbi:MAG: VWA domain-containing protein [Candidatus Krumholzibacteriia bacterium]
MLTLAHPWALLAVVPVVAVFWWRRRNPGPQAALRHSHLPLFGPVRVGWRLRLWRLVPTLVLLAALLMVVALAQPRRSYRSETVEGEGIDIMIALDISGSMRALDFAPRDRLEAAKDVIREFIDGRPNDRIGLVVFASRAFTQCPLTVDRQVLKGFLDEIEVGLIDDGTAIGLGLATAVGRLRHSTAKSRTVILLTDGMNNVPTLEPETAAELARTLGVRVYTVAIGREGVAPYPVDTPRGRRMQQIETHIDEDLLRRIAERTGGVMDRATDPQALERIFATIDKLETSRYETRVSTWHRELAGWLLAPALLLLLLAALVREVWLRRLP